MADMNFNITVDMSVAVSGFPAIKGKFPVNVNALTAIAPTITEIQGSKDDKAKVQEVPFLPQLTSAPEFVMVCPVNDKGDAITLEEGALEYSIYNYATTGDGKGDRPDQHGKSDDSATQDQHRKPLRGAHVFFNGAVEWMTDLRKDADNGKRYGLNSLYFWNHTRKPIKVQIVVGYCPK